MDLIATHAAAKPGQAALIMDGRAWAHHLDDLAAGADPAPLALDAAQGLGGSMIYTAGTTGKPKGALRTTLDPARVIEAVRALDLAEEHVHLAAGPLYHSAPG